MQGRLDGSLSFMCWVSSSASQDKKVLGEKCFVQRGRSLFHPFPTVKKQILLSYRTYGQKAGLACFWVTGSRTKGKKIDISQLTPKWKPPIMSALSAWPLCNLVLYWLKLRLSLCICHIHGFPCWKCISVIALRCLEIMFPHTFPHSP